MEFRGLRALADQWSDRATELERIENSTMYGRQAHVLRTCASQLRSAIRQDERHVQLDIADDMQRGFRFDDGHPAEWLRKRARAQPTSAIPHLTNSEASTSESLPGPGVQK